MVRESPLVRDALNWVLATNGLGQIKGGSFQCGMGAGEGDDIYWALPLCHYQVVSMNLHSSP